MALRIRIQLNISGRMQQKIKKEDIGETKEAKSVQIKVKCTKKPVNYQDAEVSNSESYYTGPEDNEDNAEQTSRKSTRRRRIGLKPKPEDDKRRRRTPTQMVLAYKNQILKSFLKDKPFIKKKLRAKPKKGPQLSREEQWKREYSVHKELIKVIMKDIQLKKKWIQDICMKGAAKQKIYNQKYKISFSDSSSSESSSAQSSSSEYQGPSIQTTNRSKKKQLLEKPSQDNSDEERAITRQLIKASEHKLSKLKTAVDRSIPNLQSMVKQYFHTQKGGESLSEDSDDSQKQHKASKSMFEFLKEKKKKAKSSDDDTESESSSVNVSNQMKIEERPVLTKSNSPVGEKKKNKKIQTSLDAAEKEIGKQQKMLLTMEIFIKKKNKLKYQSRNFDMIVASSKSLIKVEEREGWQSRQKVIQLIKEQKLKKNRIQSRLILESMMFRVSKEPLYPQSPLNRSMIYEDPYTLPPEGFTYKAPRRHYNQNYDSDDDFREYNRFRKFIKMRKYSKPKIVKYQQNSSDEESEETDQPKGKKRVIRYIKKQISEEKETEKRDDKIIYQDDEDCPEAQEISQCASKSGRQTRSHK